MTGPYQNIVAAVRMSYGHVMRKTGDIGIRKELKVEEPSELGRVESVVARTQ